MGVMGSHRNGNQRRAGIGIQQQIAQSSGLSDFFNVIADELFGRWPDGEEASRRTCKAIGYEVFRGDAYKRAITVAERRATARAANNEYSWGTRHLHRVTNDIAARLALLRERFGISCDFESIYEHGDPLDPAAAGLPPITFTRAVGVGIRTSARDAGRKIGLLPADADPMTDFLHQLNGYAEQRLHRATGYEPSGAYLPHFTVVEFGRELSYRDTGRFIADLSDHLGAHPLILHLGAVQIKGYTQQVTTI